MAETRDIKYINKEFGDFKNQLIEYAKNYFPDAYNDFSPSSPGLMFIEMAAYVGDVLSFYQDTQIQETFLQHAKNPSNLYSLAYMMGYKPSVSTAATTQIELFQTVPAIYDASTDENVPDFKYALAISENTPIRGGEGPTFLTQNKVDFSESSSLDPTTISVYEISGDQPVSFLLKKTTKAISATINTTTVTVGEPERFFTHNISTQHL